jgi:hypothetical protein
VGAIGQDRGPRRRRGHPSGPFDDVTAALGHEPAIPPGPEDTEAVFRVLVGEKGVSLDDWEIGEHLAPDTRAIPVTLLGSTFTRRDALSAVARAFDVTPDQAVVLTTELLDRDSVVRVLADPDAPTDSIRTKSGHVVTATSGDRRYTTTELTGSKYLWLYTAENLPQHHHSRFDELCSGDLKTSRAWAIKENIRHFWDYQRRGWAEKYWKS